MKPFILTMASSILWLVALPALADMHGDTQKLAEEKQCTTCHGQAEDTPGAPDFKSIAAKYSDSNMRNYLIDVVMTGGEDHWGSATMPDIDERPEVSEEEAQRLVDWILGMNEE